MRHCRRAADGAEEDVSAARLLLAVHVDRLDPKVRCLPHRGLVKALPAEHALACVCLGRLKRDEAWDGPSWDLEHAEADSSRRRARRSRWSLLLAVARGLLAARRT